MSIRDDPKTIALHRQTAGLVDLLWLGARLIDPFPKGPARWNRLRPTLNSPRPRKFVVRLLAIGP